MTGRVDKQVVLAVVVVAALLGASVPSLGTGGPDMALPLAEPEPDAKASCVVGPLPPDTCSFGPQQATVVFLWGFREAGLPFAGQVYSELSYSGGSLLKQCHRVSTGSQDVGLLCSQTSSGSWPQPGQTMQHKCWIAAAQAVGMIECYFNSGN